MKQKLLLKPIGNTLPPTAIHFVISPTYRRELAKARRVVTGTAPIANLEPQDNCINTLATDQELADFSEARCFNANTVDPDFDIDGSLEFEDDSGLDTPDAQFSGLTIVRPGKDARRWLKGYNIL